MQSQQPFEWEARLAVIPQRSATAWESQEMSRQTQETSQRCGALRDLGRAFAASSLLAEGAAKHQPS